MNLSRQLLIERRREQAFANRIDMAIAASKTSFAVWRFFVRCKTVVSAVAALVLSGCVVGPDYRPPAVIKPAVYKENGAIWREGKPSDDISKGNWYAVFHDPELDRLEEEAQRANQNLRAAIARVSEARAESRQSEASFYPTLDFTANVERERISPYNGQFYAIAGKIKGPDGSPFAKPHVFDSAQVVPFDLSYELDLWGKVRREFEASSIEAEASLADYENVLLTLKADVATNYFAVRSEDSVIQVQERTIESYEKSVRLTQHRRDAGVSTDLDLFQAKATLASARSKLGSYRQDRAKLEHGVAVLLGRAPETFSLAEAPLNVALPQIPAGLPSDLLERRPDVATAEREVAAQNEKIGVAVAAYFPSVSLTGKAGLDSGLFGVLFNPQSRIWSFGPSVDFPIFEGGRINAMVKQQRASYEENVAKYRQSVLAAFQDVENSLSALKNLQDEAEAENEAYEQYQAALNLTNDMYARGLIAYFDVIQAQENALSSEQQTAQLAGNRIAMTVQLIKALGGGWADSQFLLPHHGDHVDAPSAAPTVLGTKASNPEPVSPNAEAH